MRRAAADADNASFLMFDLHSAQPEAAMTDIGLLQPAPTIDAGIRDG
jgi:hypothetical protein